MAYVQVQSNGVAPKGTQVGDVVVTAGGNYRVVAPGTSDATYNPASGLWSVKDETPTWLSSAKSITDRTNEQYSNAAASANAISQQSSAQQYAYNSAEAQKNRDWQEKMSNTSHQREVQDLIAAGLNPVLSANLGGASTPSGSSASGSSYTGQKADVDPNLLNFYGSLLQVMMNNETQKDVAKINAETALQTAQISSAASRYNADKSAEGQSPINRTVNSITSGNSAKVVDGLKNSVSSVWNSFKKFIHDNTDKVY